MVDLKTLKFKSIDEYHTYFLNTLLPTNKTWEYFVDWNKVKKNVTKYKHEIFLLNSLRVSKNIKEELYNLIKKYPKVVKVVPSLIAERINKGYLYIYDQEMEEYLKLDFNKKNLSDLEIKQIITFCEKTKILDLLKSTKDLYDYLIGVEVGIDTNGRKGRSGKIFENMIKNLLEKILKNTSIKFKEQDNKISLFKTNNKKKINRHDFILYYNNIPFCVIEVNFYNISGSKPDSIVGNYINMQKEAKKENILFIWITDGPGWKNMKNYLRKGLEEIDYILNYKIAKEKLNIVLNEYLKNF